MIGHYFTIAWRTAMRHKLSTVSKIVALSLGLGCFVGAYTVADYFDQYDQHWTNAERIFAISQTVTTPGADTGLPSNLYVGSPVAKYLRANFPALEAVARRTAFAQQSVTAGDKSFRSAISGVDSDFLKIFDLPFLHGDPLQALSRPESAVITRRVAEALFGTVDAVGRRIHLDRDMEAIVTGVIDVIPPPSYFGRGLMSNSFDVLVSMRTLDRLFVNKFPNAPKDMPSVTEREDWMNTFFQTYVLMPRDGSFTRADLDRGLQDFGARYIPEGQGNAVFGTAPLSRFGKDSLNTWYLGGAFGIPATTILYVLGALVLGIACLDFINLSTAEATARSREIGMRKTLGASRRQICVQTMVEVAILALLSLLIAVAMVMMAISGFNHPVDVGMRMPGVERLDFWGGVGVLLIAATLMAGGYPALVLAQVRPVFAIRQGTARGGSRLFRMLLIGGQFAATSFLIVGVSVILVQNSRLRNDALTRSEDPILTIENDLGAEGIDPLTFRHEILGVPGVKGYTAATLPPYGISVGAGRYTRSSDPAASEVVLNPHAESYDYFRTTGIKLLAGREFSEDLDPPPQSPMQSRTADNEDGNKPPEKVILDRGSALAFGWTPAQAIGKTIYRKYQPVDTSDERKPPDPLQVIGVVEDAPLQLTSIGPRLFVYGFWARAPYPIIQIARDDVSGTVKRIEDVWSRVAPDVPLQRRFMDEQFESVFSRFATLSRAATLIALFAIVISVMGLIGMTTFIVGRRRREIGVRKTLGASSGHVLRLLLWEFSKPVIIANIIAWPAAFIAARTYLDLFAKRSELTALPFVVSLIATILIAWLAVGGQALRAAWVKPAQVLRYE